MPYRTQSTDTSEAAERAQFEILRRMGRKRRWEIGQRLVDEGWKAQWSALAKRHAEYSQTQLLVEWVRVHYGEDLAARYAEYLRCKYKAAK